MPPGRVDPLALTPGQAADMRAYRRALRRAIETSPHGWSTRIPEAVDDLARRIWDAGLTRGLELRGCCADDD